MPEYFISWEQVDSQGGITSKYFEGEFIDYLTADAAATSLLNAWDAVTNSQFRNVRFGEKIDFTGVANVGTVFQRASYNVNKSGGGTAAFDIPDPVSTLFVAGTNDADINVVPFTNVITEFSGADSWRISDGEEISSANRGARTYTRSGRKNLR